MKSTEVGKDTPMKHYDAPCDSLTLALQCTAFQVTTKEISGVHSSISRKRMTGPGFHHVSKLADEKTHYTST